MTLLFTVITPFLAIIARYVIADRKAEEDRAGRSADPSYRNARLRIYQLRHDNALAVYMAAKANYIHVQSQHS